MMREGEVDLRGVNMVKACSIKFSKNTHTHLYCSAIHKSEYIESN